MSRHIGKLIVHGRRMMRALGGISQTVRRVRNMRYVFNIKTVLKGWVFFQNIGLSGIFTYGTAAARTLTGFAL